MKKKFWFSIKISLNVKNNNEEDHWLLLKTVMDFGLFLCNTIFKWIFTIFKLIFSLDRHWTDRHDKRKTVFKSMAHAPIEFV